MDALKHFKIILVLICVPLLTKARKKYPRIQDVVSFSPDQHYIPRVVEMVRSELDLRTFRNNLALFRVLVRGNLDTMLSGTEQPNRRAYREVYSPQTGVNKTLEVINLQFRTKIVDCMLQLVYMARHYLKAFERHEYMDKTALAYRIGYVCKKMRILFKKSVKILELLNVKQKKLKWRKEKSATPMLALHHKVAKFNVDFEYYYAVLKRLHAKNEPYEQPSSHIKVYQLPTLWDPLPKEGKGS